MNLELISCLEGGVQGEHAHQEEVSAHTADQDWLGLEEKKLFVNLVLTKGEKLYLKTV